MRKIWFVFLLFLCSCTTIKVPENFVYKETINTKKITSIPIHRNNHYQFDIYYKYENGLIDGSKVTLSFIYN